MYKRILFPTDGSEISAKALQTAISMASLCGAALDVLAVKEPFPYSAVSEMQPVPPQDFFDAQEQVATQRVQSAVDAATAAGLVCQGFTAEGVHAWEAILDHAQRQGCDLLVMASHGHGGLRALLMGSETQKVLAESTLPVLVVR